LDAAYAQTGLFGADNPLTSSGAGHPGLIIFISSRCRRQQKPGEGAQDLLRACGSGDRHYQRRLIGKVTQVVDDDRVESKSRWRADPPGRSMVTGLRAKRGKDESGAEARQG